MINYTPFTTTIGYKELEKAKVASGFIDKLLIDPELTDPDKLQFFSHLQAYAGGAVGNIEDHCYTFFRLNKFLGTPLADKEQHFVRIMPYEKFVEWVNLIVTLDMEPTISIVFDASIPPDMREYAFEQLQNAEIKPDIINKPAECFKYLAINSLPVSTKPELKEAATCQWAMWSFPLPEDEDIFNSDKLKDLDCRAGLTAGINLTKVVYTHSVADCEKITKPTVYDAEFYDQFRPGGKTVPLTACNNLDGFDEYFHVPNKFKHILNKFALIIK